MNDSPLDIDQLIEIKPEALVRPKAPNHTSIPAMLKALQDEWDSVMLNRYIPYRKSRVFQIFLSWVTVFKISKYGLTLQPRKSLGK